MRFILFAVIMSFSLYSEASKKPFDTRMNIVRDDLGYIEGVEILIKNRSELPYFLLQDEVESMFLILARRYDNSLVRSTKMRGKKNRTEWIHLGPNSSCKILFPISSLLEIKKEAEFKSIFISYSNRVIQNPKNKLVNSEIYNFLGEGANQMELLKVSKTEYTEKLKPLKGEENSKIIFSFSKGAFLIDTSSFKIMAPEIKWEKPPIGVIEL